MLLDLGAVFYLLIRENGLTRMFLDMFRPFYHTNLHGHRIQKIGLLSHVVICSNGILEGKRMTKFSADRLLLFGATGDLSRRKLLPSLCALDADGLLPKNLAIIGTARSDMQDNTFREMALSLIHI